MKRFTLLLAAICLLAMGCQNDTTTENMLPNGENTLTISLPSTRTSLGEKDGDNYPLYWSESDRIGVNGQISTSIEIDSQDAAKAKFSFENNISYPRHITYPYHASTTAECAVVEFPTVQSYMEGTFSEGSAPMFGYVESGNSAVTLKHLAAVLCIPVKSKVDGVVLEKLVITANADANISGLFEINCSNATLTPHENCTNKITYTLPANFTLSKDKEQSLYISLPAVELNHCKVEFFEQSGKKMTANWTPSKPLARGVVREFSTVTYNPNSVVSLQAMTVEEDSLTIFYKEINGYVRYSDGTPISGVAVSDGFQVVTTNANGYYELKGVTKQTWYIYCSVPADVEMPINEFGQPCYFKPYPSDKQRYDFTFDRLAQGAENEFVIVAMADTQVYSTETIERLSAQAVPEIKSYTRSLNLPCYGVVLGDMVGDKPLLMEDLRAALSVEKIGFPVFPCYGNHDHADFNSSRPLFADERNYDFNIKVQRTFEECFGPVNYSYNRGNVHIVSMRDVINLSNVSQAVYETGFTDAQLEWLKQDLAVVPKSKMVVLCIHIPLFNKNRLGDGSNRQEVLALLDQFAEAHILSGHTHYQHPYDHKYYNTGHKIYEHCMAAVRWDSTANIHRDGTPNGYTLLFVKGNTFSNWYYKGYPHNMNDRYYQMRLYRGGSIFGTEPTGSNSYGTMGYYQLPYDNGTILANIFSSDPSWDVEVYEDGAYSGKMTWFCNTKGSAYTELVGDLTYANPKRVADGVECSRDFWAVGILFGYLGSSSEGNNYNTCYTMWRYKLKNPNAKHIEVKATDKFGNIYTESKIEDNSDIGYAFYDPKNNPVQE
jgi:hypothetical protein